MNDSVETAPDGKQRNPFLKNLSIYLAEVGRDRKWLSDVTGVNHNTINAMFTNNRWPRLDTAIQISERLSLSLHFLITGDRLNDVLSPKQRDIVEFIKKFDEPALENLHSAMEMWFVIHRKQENLLTVGQ